MTDQQRLLVRPGSPVSYRLLLSVIGEEPSDGQRRRVQRAIGIGAGIAFNGAAAGKALAASAVVKAAAGTVAVAALCCGILWSHLDGSPQALTASYPPPLAEALSQIRHHPLAPSETAAREPTAPPASTTATATATTTAVESCGDARGRLGAGPRSPDLARQIELIDIARAAIAKHDPKRALAVLDSYESLFPDGAFDQEVAVLRIESLDQQGEHQRAAVRARAFLAKNPTSPHVARVERTLNAWGRDPTVDSR